MSDRHSTFRILDANANRAIEGFRVIEEYLRLVLEDRHLTELCKHLRHELVAALALIPSGELTSARDTLGDIGTELSAPDEYQRTSLLDIFAANQKRVEQALRCLEEFSKPYFPTVAITIERLRYRTYTLAKAIDTTQRSQMRLKSSKLYVLIDGCSNPDEFATLTKAIIRGGVCVVQLRDKRLADRELLARARQLRALTRDTETLCIINDRPDLAELADADGVHLGQEELTVADARAIVGPRRLIGVSTHSLSQARGAVLDGADYLGCGPTFPSGTKTFEQFPGPDFLRQIAGEISLPAFAIGGIQSENLNLVLQAGIRRIAVSSAVLRAADPEQEVRRLKELLEASEPFLNSR